MEKRKLKELNLIDDFLWGSVVTYPEIGEQFSRILLHTIFGRDFGKILVIPQKVYFGTDTDKHGARLVFLYTRGTEGNPPENLRQLLRYVEKTTQENALNNDLKRIHQMVETVKRDEEVSLAYMKIWEREEMLIRQGRKQGIQEEQANTERERLRAENAEAEVDRLREKLKELEELLKQNKQ